MSKRKLWTKALATPSPTKQAKRSSAEAVPLEHDEQAAFFSYIELNHPALFAFAIPNAGKRSKRTGHKMVKEGLRKGVPDLMVAERCGPYAGCFIEMKRQKGSVTSKEQHATISRLRDKGYFCVIAKGWEQAVAHLNYYLSFGEATFGKV
jgi:hypothetical protein